MKFHDFHIQGYEVLDRGQVITFHLAYGYPGEETDESHITFSGVVLHHFIYSHGAIVTDIEEVSLSDLLRPIEAELVEWNRMYGVKHWEADLESYISKLGGMGLKAWEITSAIGFYGFVVAKEVASA
jgi:hypothetical protein